MDNAKLAPHEAIEIREFVSQEIQDINKISASLDRVNDNELKDFMQDSMACKKTTLKNIQCVLREQNKKQTKSQSG
jgi:similar to spore coat protein